MLIYFIGIVKNLLPFNRWDEDLKPLIIKLLKTAAVYRIQRYRVQIPSVLPNFADPDRTRRLQCNLDAR